MWQDNKKNILTLGVMTVVALVFYFFWLGPVWKDITSTRQEQSKLRTEISQHSSRGGFYGQESIRNIKTENQELAQKLNNLKDRVHFRVSPKYSALGGSGQPGQNLLIDFHQRLQELQKDLQKKSVAGNIELPSSLGFPTSNIQPEIIPDYFEKLDLVEQVVTLALESGCRKILKVGPANLFPELAGGGLVQNEWCNKNMVGLEAIGPFAAVVKFLQALQSDRRILPVERIILTNDNQSVDSVQVKILVSGIKIK
ncbi:MAG: hypothetical protein AAB019_01130 [Planctomycetota bacterium]